MKSPTHPPVEVEDGVERSRVPVGCDQQHSSTSPSSSLHHHCRYVIIIMVIIAIIIILVVLVMINTNIPIKEVLIVDKTVGVTKWEDMLVTSSLERKNIEIFTFIVVIIMIIIIIIIIIIMWYEERPGQVFRASTEGLAPAFSTSP